MELDNTTKENIDMFLTKASKDSFALAIGTNYPTKKTIKNLLQKANSRAIGVNNKISN